MINLYSDTQTQPTDAMRQAIASADVADEQRGRDPTTQQLEERVAELLGHEAAVFMPSGTMCNQIAFRLHARPGGDEMLLERTAHPIIAEAGRSDGVLPGGGGAVARGLRRQPVADSSGGGAHAPARRRDQGLGAPA